MPDQTHRQQVPIAVIGVSALFPGSPGTGDLWRHIVRGTDLTSDVPPAHWLVEDYFDPDPAAPGMTHVRRGAFLPEVPFDPVEHGLPPGLLPATDTAQLLALIVAKRLLSSALRHVDRERVAVILGVASATELVGTMAGSLQHPVWTRALREEGLPEERVQAAVARMRRSYNDWNEAVFPGLLGNVVAGRIAGRFDLGGTNCVVDAACASSLGAVAMAVHELELGTSDMVVTGGVDALNDIFMFMCFSKTRAVSPTGDCRPFAADADGTLLGEGLCMLALRRLADAERDGDPVYAVIRGIGSSSDGRAKSVYAPSEQGQARALRRAYAAAGYSPSTVGLVEAHGTGTVAGDSVELAALRGVLAEAEPGGRAWCALGSVKSQIGHTKGAAGAASLYKAVMALHHKVLPPTIKVKAPIPGLGSGEGPLYLNTAARPWIGDPGHPRRAGVSSFGFGGSNFHVTVQEYQGKAPRPARVRSAPVELFLFRAESAGGLVAALRATVDGLTPDAFAHAARLSQRADLAGAPFRLALLAGDATQLEARAASTVARLEAGETAFALPDGTVLGSGDTHASGGGLAFLFPGQGSQYVGMGGDLAMHVDLAREVWDGAAALHGGAIASEVFPPPAFSEQERAEQESRLTATDVAQPAIGVASLALLRLLEAMGLRPDCAAGHSFGELGALRCAGVVDDESYLVAAARRGAVMAAAAEGTPGAMSAVRLGAAALEPLLGEGADAAVVANHNSPEQSVVAGTLAAVEACEARLLAGGVAFRRLPTATGFHTGLVASAVSPFAAALAEVAVAAPAIPVIAGSTAAAYPGDPGQIRALLAEALLRPVRFADQVEALWERGVRTFVEVGPGGVLTDLVGACLGGRPHLAVPLDRKGAGLAGFLRGLGTLAAHGFALDTAVLWDGIEDVAPAPERRSSATVMIDGANYGKAYPPRPGAAAKRAPARVVAPVPGPDPASAPPPARSVEATAAPDPSPGRQVGPISAPSLSAIVEIQRQAAEAHAAVQRALADSHIAYLELSRAAILQVGGAPGLLPAGPPGNPDLGDLPLAGSPVPAAIDPASAAPAHPGVAAPLPATAAPKPAAPSPASAATSPPPAGIDLGALLVRVVAERTGYPEEVLTPEVGLESDLGIDSIKRVEIMAALQDAAPRLGQLDGAQIAGLRTLGEVAAWLRTAGGAPAIPVAEPDPQELLLAIVAERTGYPRDVLTPEVDLESDLGVDSIKRVEIMAALADAVPGLPEIDGAKLAGLRTLGEIAARLRDMGREGGGTDPAPRHAATVQVRDAAPRRAAAVEAEVAAPLRQVVDLSPAPAAGFGLLGLDAGPIAVVGGGQVGAAVAELLRTRGLPACVEAAPPEACRSLVWLGGLDACATPADGLRITRDAFLAAKALASRLQAGPGALCLAWDRGGEHGPTDGSDARAWLGGLPALAKTAAIEWPHAGLLAIETWQAGRDPAEVAAGVVEELLRGGDSVEVCLPGDGRRLVPRETASPLVGDGGAGAGIADGSVLLCSGGARGVAAACLLELARLRRLRLCIVGRSALDSEDPALAAATSEQAVGRALLDQAAAQGEPLAARELGARTAAVLASREARRNLDALRAAGAEVLYVRADAGDGAEMARAAALARARFGRIDGIVHAAGVLADSRLGDKTTEQFDRVMTVKAGGLLALLDACRSDDLRLLAIFSSVAGRFGNAGQADYAAASAICGSVARAEARRRGQPCRVHCLDFGPWRGGMVTPALAARFTGQGVSLLEVADGARAFADELLAPPGPVEVVLAAGDGGAALARGRGRIRRFPIRLPAGGSDWAFLRSHMVQGVPVVPAALVLEWFGRAASACAPPCAVCGVRDLRVCRGVLLPDFGDREYSLVVEFEERPGGVDLRLAGPGGEPVHYTATLPQAVERTAPSPLAPTIDVGAASLSAADAYDGTRLFHGPELQVIRAIEGMGPAGSVCTIERGRPLAWSPGRWLNDVALLDGGLQLAFLWTMEQTGRCSLPTSIGEYVPVGGAVEHGVARCVQSGTVEGPNRTRSDLHFVGEDGRVLGRLLGVEMHAVDGVLAQGASRP